MNTLKTQALVLVTGALLSAACGPSIATLKPAPGTTPVEGPGEGATANADGVRIVASAGAWKWLPTDLSATVTPILIELQNNGEHAVMVKYNRIWLTDASGKRLNVMPPYDIDGTMQETYTVQNPFYGFNNFAVAPYLTRWYPRFSRFGGTWAYDPTYYRPYLTRYAEVRLPTTDMVQRALPEGVLSPAGRASGFVYFEALHSSAKLVTLTVEMVDATSGSQVGIVHIPFTAN